MTDKQVQQLTADILDFAADVLSDMPRELCGADLQRALAAALAEHFGQAGGVMLIWYDPKDGLRVNPVRYGETR